MELKEKQCANDGCENTFRQFNSLDKYCSLKCKQKNAKPTKPKEIYVIPKQSKKRIVENAQYLVLRTEFMAKKENLICPITGQKTTDLHHKRGRIGALLTDTRYWVALSREGHRQVEENPEWAKENGYSLSRLEK